MTPASPTRDQPNEKFSPVSESRKPLIVRLRNWVGEVVLALPTLVELQRCGYELHLVGKSWAVDLLAGYDWPVHVRPQGQIATLSQLKDLKRELSLLDAGFTQRLNTLLLTNSFSSALQARLAGLRAVGVAADGRSWLLAEALQVAPELHVAQRFWQTGALLAADEFKFQLTPVEIRTSAAQREQADAVLRSLQFNGAYAVLCPFSGAGDTQGRKRWPAFPYLARLLCTRDIPLLICPGPNEVLQARQQFPEARICEDLPLGVCAQLMRQAWCNIANDTGPGHLAAATGAQLVSIYGPESRAYWSPIGTRVTLLHNLQRWPTLAEVMARLPAWPSVQIGNVARATTH
jgi:heptosyltransferase-2